MHWIYEDPVRRGLLYLGTENAIYVSFDDGENWQPLQNDLPHAPVYGITVQEHFNDLVIATYGRGFWILGRHYAAAVTHRAGARVGRPPVRAAAGVPLPAHHAAVYAVRRPATRREPALRRVDQLLLEGAGDRERDDHDSGSER